MSIDLIQRFSCGAREYQSRWIIATTTPAEVQIKKLDITVMNRILRLQQKLANKPFGNRIFSYLLARSAPYFLSIRPRVEELRPNYMRARMRKRWAVHNHIKTVHAIACCNLCEFVAGICMEVSIPRHRRWIPAGMEVAYLKKTRSNLTASVDLSEVDWDNCQEVICEVAVLDKDGDECVKALIRMKVSDKK